jgi:hypothetical protein
LLLKRFGVFTALPNVAFFPRFYLRMNPGALLAYVFPEYRRTMVFESSSAHAFSITPCAKG